MPDVVHGLRFSMDMNICTSNGNELLLKDFEINSFYLISNRTWHAQLQMPNLFCKKAKLNQFAASNAIEHPNKDVQHSNV